MAKKKKKQPTAPPKDFDIQADLRKQVKAAAKNAAKRKKGSN